MMDKIETIHERIALLVSTFGESKNTVFASLIGSNEASIRGYIKGVLPKQDILEKIARKFDVSTEWLLTGRGEMLKSDATPATLESAVASFSVSEFKQRGYAPFYSDLHVSAGQYDLAAMAQGEIPESYIKIPGVSADSFFPIIGCSFEPKVLAGDVIGVVNVERWDRLDPDKIYLIITNYDRMIKHLEVDESSSDFLWATSPNYNKFKVCINEIIRIFHVVWVGRLV